MNRKLLNLCLAMLLSIVSTAAWALSQVGGVYQIGNVDDLIAFAQYVNAGNPYADAVLTADIDRGADLTMIGKDGLDYQGVFDGQGHTITVDVTNMTHQGSAIFRNVGINAIIQNLKVQGSITTNQKLAAGIAAWCSGTIRGCYADITVMSGFAGDATHAGIAAVTYNPSVIENCLARIAIKGSTTQNCGGIVGWASSRTTVVDCLVINDSCAIDLSNGGSNNIARNDGNINVVNLSEYNSNIYDKRPNGASYNNYVTKNWGGNKATTVVPYDNLADGRICYQLNNDQSKIAWVQRIGTDPFPVPAAFGTGRVYASGATDCDGKTTGSVTFSNSGSDQAAKHQFDKFGVCSACGFFNFQCLERDPADGYLLIKSAKDIDLAESMNRFQDGFRLNLRMANDITYTAEPGRFIFNTANWFHGNFDGQGHQLTINMSDMTENNASFMPQLGGNFENVIMHGSISTSGQFAGSVTAHTRNGDKTIRNVFSDIEINASHGGDNTSAGLIGVNEVRTFVDNCIYAGNINGTETTECLAGICGWSSGQLMLTNCAFIGTLNNAIGDSKNISRNPGNVTSDNVYLINAQEFGGEEGKFTVFDGGEAGVASGQLCYYLNSKQLGLERFYQKIGTDMFPMPIKKEGALVYAVASSYNCDGTPAGGSVTYSNTFSGSANIPDHNFDDTGFCANCGSLNEEFMTPDADGWFDISTPAQLVWWTNYAAKHLDASARLTEDIDMSEYSELDEDGNCLRWANVGTERNPFYGNFDGQFHTIRALKINHPNDNGVGLIAVMNSLPSKGFGGVGDDLARKSEGVYIKNVVLDEDCEITGRGYVGLVGMTAGWAGHVNIKGVMMCGKVTANGGPNAAGVFGCVMSSACHVTIDNCGMVGNVSGPTENASFSGWLGSYAEVTNCFAVGSVEGIQDNDHYFARYSSATFTNCYARYGTQVPTVSAEDFASGALAWRANGYQFRTPYWYQTIGDDDYPFPDPSHGTVIFAAGQYFSIASEEDIDEVAAVIADEELNDIDNVKATQSVIDAYVAAVNALSDATNVIEFADAIDTLNVKKDALAENVAVYQAYITKCEMIRDKLANDDSFHGTLREALEAYLDETNYEEPSEENPLGTYDFIITEHVATAEEIQAEIARLDQWLADAIAEDYQPGTDVSNLIPNGDFSKQKEGWTNAWSTGYGSVANSNTPNATVVGVEAWNVTGDQYQTVEGMKPGYYLVGTHAAFRPSNDRYSTNYAAGFYANGIFNYFPAVIEDPVSIENAVDQVNCNLTGAGAHDLNIYEDGYSTEGNDSIGFVVHGETGMAAAANAGRYQVYTIAKVGEDGKLTIGIKNPGTKYSNDWTGWSAIKVVYCGEDETVAGESLDLVLENMAARAETILAYEFDEETAEAAPNYPAELLEQLDVLLGAIEGAETVEDKAALAKDFSDTFLAIYEGKQAYISLFKLGSALENMEGDNLALVEKDPESGEWIETGDLLFTEDETDACYDLSQDLLGAYIDGSYSTQEALDAVAEAYSSFAGILPQKDSDGFFLIGTPKEFAGFRVYSNYVDSKAKAKLTADIDMTGIAMQPINTKDNPFRGTFDGQAHALANVYITRSGLSNDQCTALFEFTNGATVKNLKLTGEYYSDSKYIAGIVGKTYGKSVIDNCDVAVKMYSAVSGDGTHGGLIGVNEEDGTVVSNCLVNCPMFGEATTSCGGVIGWSTNASTVKNTLILSQGSTINTGSGCNTISRNDGNCTVSNVYYVETIGSANGTKAEAEKLASGEITYKLNGSTSEGNLVWFQTLGTDATPHLFDGDIVYLYGGEYMNEKPNPQLNAFAYDLEANMAGSNVIVSFKLNAEAEAAEVRFSNGYTKAAEGELKVGANRITVPASALGEDPTALTYEVAVTGKGSLDVLKVGDSYKFNSPYGLTINNNPASTGFGQVLVTETRPTEDPSGMFSTGTPGALFAFNAAFKPVGSYYGGLDIAGETPLKLFGEYQLDLKDVHFSKDGRLFVARASGTSASSVWEINPDDLSEAWKPVFTGGELDEATGITYVGDDEQNRPAVGLALESEGDDLRMYVLGVQGGMEEAAPAAFNCAFYNLGTATEWSTVPSGYLTALDGAYAAIPTHIGIHEDHEGGLWFIQSVSSPSEEIPAIKHFDREGNEDYSDITTNTHSGKMAITADGAYLAVAAGQGKVVLYEVNYVPMASGLIFPNPKYNISVSESNITGLAFDFANNLYVASSGTKTLSRYVIPSWNNNLAITPGNGVGTGIAGDVNGDGYVDGGDAQQILNVMSVDGYDTKCDVNKDGFVDGGDYQQVLNIMSAQ